MDNSGCFPTPMHPFRSLPLALLATTIGSTFAAEPTEFPELSALRRDFEKRKSEAVRPVFSWYETELNRIERSFTVRGNLDAALAVRKEREISRSEQAAISPVAFKTLLDDTRWRWNGSVPQDITFKRDGFLECQEWARQGFVLKWQVAGANTVTYTIVKGPTAVGKEVVLTFSRDLNSFTGVNNDGLPINASPRLK